ncbi:transmembrane protein 121B [Patella vulgata]|uniref:transmembrane protein 121B n=1 Tax=Patella vulgata TaxID=6465 RepID=UPI0021809480|nr:transmembrane protein 121B [Patella vulgata]XP_050413164.1 transmembrane protein 121B [Patella vulgata]XP_050413165.1 transmembrane protein 121B [Patella vulgata]
MDKCALIPTRIITILLVILQGTILDYYLIKYNNWYWYAWIAADLALLFVFIMTFVISYRHLNLMRTSTTPVQVGSLPLVYFAWLVYSILLAIRVGLIFKDIAWKLKEEDFFGPNTLKVTISLAAVIFFLLLQSHHNAPCRSRREHQIENLTKTVVFDILDSVDILDVFFLRSAKDALLPGLEEGILVIACLNFILPTLPLMTLSRIHFGFKVIPRNIDILHRLLLLFFVNAPLLSIRLVLWHRLDQDISTFIVKNLFIIVVMLYELHKEFKHGKENLGRNDNTHVGLDYPGEEEEMVEYGR